MKDASRVMMVASKRKNWRQALVRKKKKVLKGTRKKEKENVRLTDRQIETSRRES